MTTFGDEFQLEVEGGVALLTWFTDTGEHKWGTRKEEHRFNPDTLKAFLEALDAVEAKGEEVNVLVFTNEGKFWCNGFDVEGLQKKIWPAEEAAAFRLKFYDELCPRILTYPLPTVAVMKGHWTGPASAALGLAFDYRCMSSDRGLFFTGQVTQPMVQEIIKAKVDDWMQREAMVFNNKRFGGEECAKHGAVDIAAPTDEILDKGLELAQSLVAKGKGPARKALAGIKKNVYKKVLDNVGEQKALDALKMSDKVAKGLGGGSASVGQGGGKISNYPTAPAKQPSKM